MKSPVYNVQRYHVKTNVQYFIMPVLLLLCAGLVAQDTAPITVPKLIRLSGSVVDASGQLTNRVVGITFSLYKEESSDSPIWAETQNVLLNNSGHYTVFLGASKPDGLPLELFVSGEARWLGVRVENQREQKRTLLLSVPYALKSAHTETFGGLPPSAFVKATPTEASTSRQDLLEHRAEPQAVGPT